MKELTAYEEFAMALDGVYGDTFEDITSDVELVNEAMKMAKKECPDVSDDTVKKVAKEVLKLYAGMEE